MLWSQLGVQGPAGQGIASATPNRGTPEQQLDQWNQALRQSPVYQTFMRQMGLPTDGRAKLSREQQSLLERALKNSGINIPSGMHIDQGGNLNQKNRLGRNLIIGGAIGGATLGTLGALGAFGGAGGAGGAGAGAAATGTGAGALGAMPAVTTTSLGAAPALAGAGVSATGGGALSGTLGTLLRYGVPAATSLINGYLGSRAVNNATEAQTDAINKAMQFANQQYGDVSGQQRQLYDQARNTQANLYNSTAQTQNAIYNNSAGQYAPYMQLGAGSLGNLSSMTGGGPISAPPPFQPIAAPAPISGASVPTSTQGAAPTMVQNTPSTPAQPLPTPTDTGTAPPEARPEVPQAQAQLATASSYGPMVSVRAPTGEIMQMPESYAAAFVNKGAQIVS